MKKISLLTATIAICLGFQGVVFCADQTTQKYAVVDVKKVVNSSNSVKKLKEERKKQKEDVIKFVKEGNAQVAAEKDPKKKEALKKQLNNDLKIKTTNYDKKYQTGLKQINNELGANISKIGKEKKYDLILTSDSVLYGGEDITKEIIKITK